MIEDHGSSTAWTGLVLRRKRNSTAWLRTWTRLALDVPHLTRLFGLRITEYSYQIDGAHLHNPDQMLPFERSDGAVRVIGGGAGKLTASSSSALAQGFPETGVKTMAAIIHGSLA